MLYKKFPYNFDIVQIIKRKMINYNKLNLFKKLYYGITARTNRLNDKIRFVKMRNLQSIFDQQSNTYHKDRSYRIQWFNVQHERTLAEWDSVTDSIYGGQSTAQLQFDKQNKCISYEGYVETRDKDRMVYYPFINLMRTHPFLVKLGPMRLFQVEAKTDGKPLEVHFEFRSLLKGQVNIYAFLLSKSTEWHTYQIPIQNMILRGTQEDYHDGINPSRHQMQYFSKFNESSIFQKDNQSVKKIIKTEIWDEDSLEIANVGFRLVSTQSEQRHIKIRNINFCYKKGYEKFAAEYTNPYLYITEDQVIKEQGDVKAQKCKVEFLRNGLEKVDVIDTGDVKYYRNNKKNKR